MISSEYVHFITSSISIIIAACSLSGGSGEVFFASLAPLAAASESSWSASRDARGESLTTLVVLLHPSPDEEQLVFLTKSASQSLFRALEKTTTDEVIRASQTVAGLSLLGGISGGALDAVSSIIYDAMCGENVGTKLPSLLSSTFVNALNAVTVDESTFPAPSGLPLSAGADAALLGQLLCAVLEKGARRRRESASSSSSSLLRIASFLGPLYDSDRKVAFEIAQRGESDASSLDLASRWSQLACALRNNGDVSAGVSVGVGNDHL